MNRMKTLFASLLLCAAALLLAPRAHAQYGTYGAQAITLGSTNDVRALTTNTLQKPIDATQYKDIGLSLTFKMTAAGTSNLIFRFEESLDGTTWSTHNRYVMPFAANGTTAVTYVTNLTTGGIGYMRLATAENTNAAGIFTNVVVSYSIKPRF